MIAPINCKTYFQICTIDTNKIINFFKTVWVAFWWLTFTMLMWFPIGLAGLLSRRGTLAYQDRIILL